MKIDRMESPLERIIVAKMITNTEYLRSILPIYSTELLQTEFTRIVANWCVEYYKQFSTAPGREIKNIFLAKRETLKDPEIVESFLNSISRESTNVPHLIQRTVEYFESVQLLSLKDTITHLVENQNWDGAMDALSGYRPISISKQLGFNPYNKSTKIKTAFRDSNKPLFTFPGALGKMINSQLVRDSFIGIMAPEKRGKTWWLIEFAHRAYKNNCNVVFFQLGDLSEKQQILRFSIRLAGKSNKKIYCTPHLVPTLDCRSNQNNSCKRKQRGNGLAINWEMYENLDPEDFFGEYSSHEPCKYCENKYNFNGAVWFKKRDRVSPLTWKESLNLGRKFASKNNNQFRLVCVPAGTLSIENIRSCLLEYDFSPTVIVIDYADLISPTDSKKELRHQQNKIWESLRAISSEMNCMVITATQADASSYKEKSLSLTNFSESKGKYAHVTCMLGLNQTNEEKRMGIMRINQILVREDEFNIKKEVVILQCLRIGRPFLNSYIKW